MACLTVHACTLYNICAGAVVNNYVFKVHIPTLARSTRSDLLLLNTALWLYRQVLSTVVCDEELTVYELKFQEEKRVLTIINGFASRLSISMTLAMKGTLSADIAAAVITSKLMRSGDIESNPGPGTTTISMHFEIACMHACIQYI